MWPKLSQRVTWLLLSSSECSFSFAGITPGEIGRSSTLDSADGFLSLHGLPTISNK